MINIKRLKERIFKMALIGATENGGVTRLALSEEDKEARELLITWMQKLALNIRIDDFGNIYGRKEGNDPEASTVMIGSHIDTVPKGGKYDGVLGVLGGLEAVETLIEKKVIHRRPIEIVSFTNEEGARFTPQMLGSGAITKQFSQEYTYNRTDTEGLRFKDELKRIDFLGEKKNRPKHVNSFIELHIEQGPTLEMDQRSIGIVEGIAGFSWFEITIEGEANHSGTTPMKYRQDSLIASIQLIQKLNNWALQKEDGTVLTVGKIESFPGTINVIAEKTTFTVDVRIQEKNQFDLSINEIKLIIEDTMKSYSMEYKLNEIRTQPPVPFSEHLTDLVEKICNEKDLSYKRMKSGAGHDAMYMKNIADTVMIFVPSIKGISHNEKEVSSLIDIEIGVNLLYETIKHIAE